ncbi:CCA tRNA nucleotidyltransferase [Pediococcus claussenii]|uniref:CCA tRNA nucleotidyltransferase n=1 Tax=Pediococcus claussenii TaxID=187452 RepID=UPI000308D6E4|nr:CCA tRNA nucleotidyltransferase [Pediococcus claussenii]ANZ70414.1 CCA tRNA nucleotidyltransferase [Pediococcus claussenii]ANZ72230.1 CCA tRNA nucleotidyltransferase [Pediococcus claussenii]
MKLTEIPEEFRKARPILKKINDAGFKAYFVGGSVRDSILNKPLHDIDIATSAYPTEIKQIFPKTVDTGIKHGTVMVIDDGTGYEITTFRTEGAYQDFRRPDNVTFVRSLEEDLKRRDFTINALALSEDGNIIDLFGGIKDLNNHMIRAVGDPEERFHEDALRMMRAVRFASQLDFSIEKNTIDAITKNSHLLKKIAVERILVEFEKMMLGKDPSIGISEMLESHMTEFIPESKVITEALNDLSDKKFLNIENTVQLWSIILFTTKQKASEIHSFLKKWKTSNELIQNVQDTVFFLEGMRSNRINNQLLFNTGEKNLENALHISGLFEMDVKNYKKDYEKLTIKSNKELAITGNDLILNDLAEPGPQMGVILKRLKEQVIDGMVANEKNKLLEIAKTIKEL